MSSPLEMFSCAVYACRLSRSACAERHREASRSPRDHTYGPTLRWSRCGGCEVGAAHARGERPDVAVTALVRREEVEVPKPKQFYTHAGKTLTTTGWAAEDDIRKLGLTAQAIASRIDGGWTVEDALTTPKGSPRPATSARPKPAKPLFKPEPKRRPIADAVKLGKSIERARANIERARANASARAADEDVRDLLTALPPAELLTRLGYVVEDAGLVPAGRLLLVRGAV